MLSVRRPSEARVRALLEEQSKLKFTYSAVGGTAAAALPTGFVVNHTQVALGKGDQTFVAASNALRQWRQFRLGWVDLWPHDAPVETGQCVAVVARLLGAWWVNACRIVYIIDEQGPVRRFGFANGTLPAHVGIGEERFLIEWDRESDTVSYDVLALSRPNRLIARMGYPYMRHVQRRFGRESAAAMVRATTNDIRTYSD